MALITFRSEILNTRPIVIPPFRVDGLIPSTGDVLLYGKFGTGKTPFAVEMANALSLGTPFLGFTTTQSRVLYIQLDMPIDVFQKRFASRIATMSSDVWWSFSDRPINILNLAFAEQIEFENIQRNFEPEVVYVDTLKKSYSGNEKDGDLPKQIYAAFAGYFPQSVRVYLHHDRKTSNDDSSLPESESFSVTKRG